MCVLVIHINFDTLQYAPVLLNKNRILNETFKDTSKISPFTYTYFMMNLNVRKLNLKLIQKKYIIVVIWVGDERRSEERNGEGGRVGGK